MPATYFSLSGYTILIAEDHTISLAITKEFLEQWGAQVIAAEDGVTAVALFKNNNPDLVVMDIQLPALNGIDAANAIKKTAKQSNKTIWIIGMSADDLTDKKNVPSFQIFDELINKPFSSEELNHKIHYLLLKNDNATVQENAENYGRNDFKHIDVNELLKHSGSNASFIPKLISLLIELLPEGILNIRNAIVLKDAAVIRNESHRLKPHMQMIGNKLLLDAMESLENANPENSKWQNLSQEYNLIENEMIAVIKELHHLKNNY